VRADSQAHGLIVPLPSIGRSSTDRFRERNRVVGSARRPSIYSAVANRAQRSVARSPAFAWSQSGFWARRYPSPQIPKYRSLAQILDQCRNRETDKHDDEDHPDPAEAHSHTKSVHHVFLLLSFPTSHHGRFACGWTVPLGTSTSAVRFQKVKIRVQMLRPKPCACEIPFSQASAAITDRGQLCVSEIERLHPAHSFRILALAPKRLEGSPVPSIEWPLPRQPRASLNARFPPRPCENSNSENLRRTVSSGARP
jgi:hypothetical protein